MLVSMSKVLSLCLCLIIAGSSLAQYDNLVFGDNIYVPNIKTVQLNLIGLPNSLPIYELGKPAALELSFDDLDNNVRYYTYTLIHCDMFWNPSNLVFHEYARGFEQEEIIDQQNSIGTRIPFGHYRINIPNRNTEITISGNYLLVVYEEGDTDRPAFSKRFVVIEPPVIGIRMIKVRPGDVAKMNTHQEIRFDIDTKELNVRDPKNEIMCTVLQNGRWDNALYDIRSRFENGPLLVFNYMDKIVFPAGKEFRSIDLRSTQYRGEGVFSMEKVDGYVRVLAKLDKPRVFDPYFSKIDLNGQFVIQSTDYPNPEFFNLRSDYVETIFTLESRKYDEDVYIFGALSDWSLKEEFRMTYDEAYGSYQGNVFLKQGFYDYIYVLANADATADEATIEGNWYESTNDYTLIVYYRPFGARYDRAIAASSFEWGR